VPRPAAAGLHRGRQGNVALSPPVRTPCLHSTFLDPYTDTPTVTVNDGGWRSPPTGRLDGETVPPACHVEARSSAQAVHHRQVVAWSSMEDGAALPGAMPDAEWSLGADGSGRTVPRPARCMRVVAAAQQRRHTLIPIAPGRQAAWGRVRLHAGQRPPAAMRTPPLRPGPAVAFAPAYPKVARAGVPAVPRVATGTMAADPSRCSSTGSTVGTAGPPAQARLEPAALTTEARARPPVESGKHH